MASTIKTNDSTILIIKVLLYKDSMSMSQYPTQSNTYYTQWRSNSPSDSYLNEQYPHYKKLGLFQRIYFKGSLKMVAIAYNFVR